MKHRILFLDDETNILNTMKRLLRNEPYELSFFTEGVQALDFLKDNWVSVIVSDMRMPKMNGVEFLKKAHSLCPDSVKIILSGYGDIEDILKAVNHGKVDSFIQKPWNDEALKIRLKNGCISFSRKQREKELVRQLEQKNKQLQGWNQELEKIVAQRTAELTERNRLLNMMVEGKPREEILIKSCESLKRIMKLDKAILLEVKNGRYYPDGTKPPDEVMKRQEIGKNVIVQNYLCYQMEEGKRLFGYLYLYPVRALSKEKKRTIQDFASMMEMILLQQSYLEKSDLIVDSIDSILGEISAQSE